MWVTYLALRGSVLTNSWCMSLSFSHWTDEKAAVNWGYSYLSTGYESYRNSKKKRETLSWCHFHVRHFNIPSCSFSFGILSKFTLHWGAVKQGKLRVFCSKAVLRKVKHWTSKCFISGGHLHIFGFNVPERRYASSHRLTLVSPEQLWFSNHGTLF